MKSGLALMLRNAGQPTSLAGRLTLLDTILFRWIRGRDGNLKRVRRKIGGRVVLSLAEAKKLLASGKARR